MGNQGTKDWKLTVFFAISLMLIAGLFGNAAIAGNGDGMITVGWSTTTGDSSVSTSSTDPLPAGYEGNSVQFAYTVTDTSMVGGALQITIPDGWSIPKIAGVDARQFVKVTVGADTIYETDAGDITIATTDPRKVTHGSFSLSDTKIGFTFGRNWSNGGTLVILLGSVTTPIPSLLREDLEDLEDNKPYITYTFETRSKARNGTFVRLRPSAENPDTQPLVRVGNIRGTRTEDEPYSGRELTKRVVAVTPATSYPGETHNYIVTFTAPGPMYNSSLAVTFPLAVFEFPEGKTASNQISVSAPGVSFSVDPIGDDWNGGVLTVNLTRINNGQKVTITLKDAMVIGTGTSVSAATMMAGASSITVTRITGGAFALVAGSGTLAVSPDYATANAILRSITVTYTAATKLTSTELTSVDLVITVPGGITASTGGPLGTDSKQTGYVSGPRGVALTVSGNTITWSGVNLAKGGKLTTRIANVKVDSAVDILEFSATQGGRDLVPATNFYVVALEDESVTFDSDASSVSAASLQTVEFTFRAVDTPIGGGKVQFSIPSGWTAPVKTKDDVLGAVTVKIGEVDHDTDLTVSGRSITVAVKSLARRGTVVVTYGGEFRYARVQNRAGPVKIDGYYWASSRSGRSKAGTVEIEVTNAESGTGTGTVRPTTAKGGSIDETFTIVYDAAGTMDGGRVSLEHPDDWGPFETDPTKLNYISVRASGGATIEETDNGGSIIIVTLGKCPPRSKVTFTYGTGTGASRGARVQDTTGVAWFTIQSQGEESGGLLDVTGTRKKATVTADDPDYLGETFTDAAGQLRVDVTGGDDGTGTATVDIVKSKKGDVEYTDANGVNLTDPEMRVHAADDGTYIKFVYTPTETIENGALRFTVPDGWSEPQGSNPGAAGFTSIQAGGGARLEEEAFGDLFVEVPIILINVSETIEIHYGEAAGDGGGAVVPAESGTYVFTIETKAGDADTNAFRAIRGTVDGDRLEVRVYNQASGGGSAAVTAGADNLTAGGAAEITIVYTAAGDITNGKLKLTTPTNWSHPVMTNVDIKTTGSVGSSSAMDFGGYYVGDPDDDADDKEVPKGGPGAMDVLVDGVSLDEGETVTFVYSAAMVQPTTGNAAFAVAVDGGAGPGAGPLPVTPDPEGALTVSVGDASPGSGSGEVVLQQAIVAGEGGHTLTFIYTAAAAITDRKLDIRVEVPTGWSVPTDKTDADARGSFTVTHQKLGASGALKLQTAASAAVEKIGPFDREMAARLKSGRELAAGDQVVFNYENADAPATIGVSTFVMYYGAERVTRDTDLTVLVGSGKDATMLMVDAPGTLLVEAEAPAMITVELQDEDGNEVPAAVGGMEVMLASSSATGSFMADGEAVTSITISAGTSSAMASYTDSTLGDAMITASSGTLTAGTATIMVTTNVVMVKSATFTITDSDDVAKDVDVARDGDTITVTAIGTRGKMATVTIGSITVSARNMEESPDSPGTYTHSQPVANGSPEGDHAITVQIGGTDGPTESAGSVTVDNTAPTVTVSDIEGMVANGDTVVISAMVDDGAGSGVTSVMADVSMLDSEADPVALTDADGDGTYTGSFTISDGNMAGNGAQAITVTATDAAGNSSEPATVMVELQNTLSYTSTLPAGISLFHVPLDEEGLDTVGDLEAKLGDNVNLLIIYDGTLWNSRSSDVMITSDLGILVSLSAETTVMFEGNAWGGGSSMISLQAGSNLVGLPVDDDRVTNVSDIMGLFAAGTVSSVIVASGGEFQLVTAAGDAADGPVAGDAAYLVIASAAGSATLSGEGWSNDGTTGAAPIALVGYTVDNQTPALNVHGSVVDEITGLTREGFRVKVKNLSTKSALSHITDEATDGYDMTFVDLADSYAARVGDVLEITADSPSPLIGVQPVRHIVTVDDVKGSRIQLEDLIAYEIPAETELLRNYPNPFNPETWIPYHLAEDADVTLTIYDATGKIVRTIDVGLQTAAKYNTRSKAIYWDGRNSFGEQVASGMYFYSLSAGDFSATRRMVILK